MLLVEDDREIRQQMKWALASEYSVLEATDRQGTLTAVFRDSPELIVLDLSLPPEATNASERLATLRDVLNAEPSAKVIVVTRNDEPATAIAAIEVYQHSPAHPA